MKESPHFKYFNGMPEEIASLGWLASGDFFAEEVAQQELTTKSGIVLSENVDTRDSFASNRPRYFQVLQLGPLPDDFDGEGRLVPDLKVGDIVLLGPASYQEISNIGPFLTSKSSRFVRSAISGVAQRFHSILDANKYEDYLCSRLEELGGPEGNS